MEVKATNQLSWINLMYDYPFRQWASAHFFNVGPSAVDISINYPDRPFTLLPNEARILEHGEGIRIVYLKCFPGLMARVLVEGVVL